MSKKPDNVVYDEDLQVYNAKSLAFGTNITAPKIELTDISNWKNNTVSKVNHLLSARFENLQEEYKKLQEQYEYNQLIYEAKFNFEPIIGNTYHLYKKADKTTFLSILAPNECNFDYIKSFKLNVDQIWEIVN